MSTKYATSLYTYIQHDNTIQYMYNNYNTVQKDYSIV